MAFLVEQPIDLANLVARVARADRGAIVTFAGQVRDHHAGRRVVSLSYTAYGPMAEEVCEAIVATARERWPVEVAVQHRIGELAIGDAAIGVAVAGPHRDEAFAACRWVVDEVKARAPIWKRERYADGSEGWVDPTMAGGSVSAGGQ